MQALEFWKAVTVDHSNLLERFVEWLHVHSVRFCLVGGQAVNASVDPVVSLDLDLAGWRRISRESARGWGLLWPAAAHTYGKLINEGTSTGHTKGFFSRRS